MIRPLNRMIDRSGDGLNMDYTPYKRIAIIKQSARSICFGTISSFDLMIKYAAAVIEILFTMPVLYLRSIAGYSLRNNKRSVEIYLSKKEFRAIHSKSKLIKLIYLIKYLFTTKINLMFLKSIIIKYLVCLKSLRKTNYINILKSKILLFKNIFYKINYVNSNNLTIKIVNYEKVLIENKTLNLNKVNKYNFANNGKSQSGSAGYIGNKYLKNIYDKYINANKFIKNDKQAMKVDQNRIEETYFDMVGYL